MLHEEKIMMYVLPHAKDPLILGLPWLQQHNPWLDWRTGELTSWSPNCLSTCISISCNASSIESPEIEDQPQIPSEYRDFSDVFSKSRAFSLPPHRDCDCAINLLEGATMPKGRLYPVSISEEAALENYIRESLLQGIHRTQVQFLGYMLQHGKVAMDDGKTLDETIRQANEGRSPPPGCPPGVQYVPRGHREALLRWVHAHHSSGHPGVNTTQRMMSRRYWWPSWRRETQEYCVLGYQPPLFPWDSPEGTEPRVEEWYRQSRGARQKIQRSLCGHVERQRLQADRHRRAGPTYRPVKRCPLRSESDPDLDPPATVPGVDVPSRILAIRDSRRRRGQLQYLVEWADPASASGLREAAVKGGHCHAHIDGLCRGLSRGLRPDHAPGAELAGPVPDRPPGF
ncbi:uncharacterized protein LOC125727500 [Brienomyrus brachyistius]|uniref:uncharacterized protein LOC125727500 n=1 Tax=Brienomyrus brachyistius TaxID=42636 RepID=UPI0020B1BB95|nr:uncharacterized protein LOC125727500 [Brienomyrus brachyistius]